MSVAWERRGRRLGIVLVGTWYFGFGPGWSSSWVEIRVFGDKLELSFVGLGERVSGIAKVTVGWRLNGDFVLCK